MLTRCLGCKAGAGGLSPRSDGHAAQRVPDAAAGRGIPRDAPIVRGAGHCQAGAGPWPAGSGATGQGRGRGGHAPIAVRGGRRRAVGSPRRPAPPAQRAPGFRLAKLDRPRGVQPCCRRTRRAARQHRMLRPWPDASGSSSHCPTAASGPFRPGTCTLWSAAAGTRMTSRRGGHGRGG